MITQSDAFGRNAALATCQDSHKPVLEQFDEYQR